MSAPVLSLYYSDRSEDGRAYRAPQALNLPDVPSVTTVLKLTNKEALVQWAANLTAHYAATQTDMILTRSVPDAVRGLQYHYKSFRDERAEVGTAVHEFIEADMNGTWDYPEIWDREVAECVEQYVAWKGQHVVEPLMVETTLWSETHGYAGTVDFIGLIDGEMWLVDAKTSRNTWAEHEYQISALERADFALVQVEAGTEGAFEYTNPKGVVTYWLKVAIPEIQRRGFLHIRPNYTDPLSGKFTPGFARMVEVDGEDIDPLFHTFLGYKQAWDGIEGVKALRKLREKDSAATVEENKEER